jgi:DNA topoisomerase-6 subunit A
MAKKSGKADASGRVNERIKKRDADTQKKIVDLATGVVKKAYAQKDLLIDIPTRSKSNTIWDKRSRILRMGDASSARELFNLNQAKQFMQTMLHGNSVRELIQADKTLSLRGMFYKGLHTVVGTSEKTFGDQDESDGILEDLEVSLGSLREELHIYAKKRGTMVGNITIIDNGDEIDCRRMGTGGYAIPGIVEPDIIQFKKCDAKFVLHVEKDTVWGRFNEDRFWEEHNCILTEGSGQPTRGVRRLLRRLNEELGLPVYCLLDCDPWGHYIYSVIKQGSINLAYESMRMAVPKARFLGLSSFDAADFKLGANVSMALKDEDRARADQLMKYEWFSDKRWQAELAHMKKTEKKYELEALSSRGIRFISEEYIPEKIKQKRWLD